MKGKKETNTWTHDGDLRVRRKRLQVCWPFELTGNTITNLITSRKAQPHTQVTHNTWKWASVPRGLESFPHVRTWRGYPHCCSRLTQGTEWTIHQYHETQRHCTVLRHFKEFNIYFIYYLKGNTGLRLHSSCTYVTSYNAKQKYEIHLTWKVQIKSIVLKIEALIFHLLTPMSNNISATIKEKRSEKTKTNLLIRTVFSPL